MKSNFGYDLELLKWNIPPFDKDGQGRESIKELADKLLDFDWESKDKDVCRFYNQDYTGNAGKVYKEVMVYFDGLCLDCLDRIKSKTQSSHDDYWEVDRIKQWDKNCRVKHGQATWYFSFLGRREDREKMRRKYEARRRSK